MSSVCAWVEKGSLRPWVRHVYFNVLTFSSSPILPMSSVCAWVEKEFLRPWVPPMNLNVLTFSSSYILPMSSFCAWVKKGFLWPWVPPMYFNVLTFSFSPILPMSGFCSWVKREFCGLGFLTYMYFNVLGTLLKPYMFKLKVAPSTGQTWNYFFSSYPILPMSHFCNWVKRGILQPWVPHMYFIVLGTFLKPYMFKLKVAPSTGQTWNYFFLLQSQTNQKVYCLCLSCFGF